MRLHLKNKIIFFAVFAAVLFGGTYLHADGAGFPVQTGDFVDDYAGMLAPTDEVSVSDLLKKLMDTENVHVCFVTVSSTATAAPGYDPETLAAALYKNWHIDETTGKGILFLVSRDDRRVAIETGGRDKGQYERLMNEVVKKHMLPNFKENDYGRGIYDGARAVAGLIETRSSFAGKVGGMAPFIAVIVALAGLFIFLIRLAESGRRPAVVEQADAYEVTKKQDDDSFGGGAAGTW
jgi:uncharacterized membrane protein YgcG